ncbi:hypothetical protein Nmel_017337, partial [Mimus melanotis]
GQGHLPLSQLLPARVQPGLGHSQGIFSCASPPSQFVTLFILIIDFYSIPLPVISSAAAFSSRPTPLSHSHFPEFSFSLSSS